MRKDWTNLEIKKLANLYEAGLTRKEIEMAIGRPWTSIKYAVWKFNMKRKYVLPKANVLTGAGSFFCAAHRDTEGNLHGHTWEVTAWWSGTPDAVERQSALNAALKEFDHTVLDNSMAWGEKLGRVLIKKLGCQKVEISRPLERLYAVIER